MLMNQDKDKPKKPAANGLDPDKPPKIAFPCPNYPIKSLGVNSNAFMALVMKTMEEHAPGFDQNRVTTRESGKGRFISITVYITATGEAHLKTIFETLKKHPDTRMVL